MQTLVLTLLAFNIIAIIRIYVAHMCLSRLLDEIHRHNKIAIQNNRPRLDYDTVPDLIAVSNDPTIWSWKQLTKYVKYIEEE